MTNENKPKSKIAPKKQLKPDNKAQFIVKRVGTKNNAIK